MHLTRLVLQNFRSYQQQTFTFDPQTTLLVGPNTAGKTNLVEALYLLSFGKSFRTEKDMQMMRFEEEVGRVQGLVEEPKEPEEPKGPKDKIKLEVVLAQGAVTGGRFAKKFLVNDVPKRRVDFEGVLPLVLFSPEELEIIVDGPSLRRRFLDDVLEQIDREYRLARVLYDKALRQRNALLSLAKETGVRNKEQFVYWDELLITNGSLITQKRNAFLEFVSQEPKDIFPFTAQYDKSTISEERLLQYVDAEVSAGVTLVGPHRDDFFVTMENDKDVRYYGSRGQQRMVVLQLKLLQIRFMSQALGFRPLLVLDDIFSELDEKNTAIVLEMINRQQTIMTTASQVFLKEHNMKEAAIVRLPVNQ